LRWWARQTNQQEAPKPTAPRTFRRAAAGRNVSRVLCLLSLHAMGQERWSSIWDGRRRPPLAAYPRLGGAGRTSPPIWPCSGWGLPCHHCYQWCGGLLPHRFTLTRISGEPSIRAVSFLWPYPSPCGAQALPGSLPCGARTFLGYLAAPATIVSDQWLQYSGPAGTRGSDGKQMA